MAASDGQLACLRNPGAGRVARAAHFQFAAFRLASIPTAFLQTHRASTSRRCAAPRTLFMDELIRRRWSTAAFR
ncbi:MAG: hypothetical protein MZV49_04270 [Rhodopseudomonas palustris]|nr:hypothetical protein [Rhodopseudomonas palustris]